MDLLIDDQRTFNVDCIARTYEAGMIVLQIAITVIDKLYLDFDLGEEKTGLDILKDAAALNALPKVIQLVSGNPPGLKQMRDFLTYDAGYVLDGIAISRFVKEEIKHPICPLNLYFEGDENKCDTSKCDFDTECRGCSTGCETKRNNQCHQR